jgi:tetratricopeptide (TPR) repeat protein
MIESRRLSEPAPFRSSSGSLPGRPATGGRPAGTPNEGGPRPLSPGERRKLQSAFESANTLIRQGATDRRRIHALYSLCVAGDRFSTHYVLAFLDNLEQMSQASGVSGWVAQWQTPRGALRDALARQNWTDATRIALSILDRVGPDLEALTALAKVAEADESPELAWIYWHFVANKFSDCADAIDRGAVALDQLGRFEEAADWRRRTVAFTAIAKSLPDNSDATKDTVREVGAWDAREVVRRANALIATGALDEAEKILSTSMMSLGNDFRVRETWEELQLARARSRAQEAASRAATEGSLEYVTLAKSLDDERCRLEVRILDSRSQRYPWRIDLRVELIDRLRQSQRFPEMLRQIDSARKLALSPTKPQKPDEQVAEIPADLFWQLALWEGEAWQSLKVFAKSLKAYQAGLQNVPAETLLNAEAWLGLLYRTAILEAAMGDQQGAKREFEALLAIRPDYKDAQQRLDNLP